MEQKSDILNAINSVDIQDSVALQKKNKCVAVLKNNKSQFGGNV